uniref:Uncharacterized protein n=1 Tax=Setaria viridis TaxID=4556 RepID=A0A4U6VUR5_SETVI|nr:hypothetical protein SEVIR_2G184301v2 [Setaria viridis]
MAWSVPCCLMFSKGGTNDQPNEEVDHSQTDIYLNMSGDGNEEQPIAEEGNDGQQGEPSGSSSRPKQKRGKKKKNLEGRIIITKVDEDGKPIASHNAKIKLVNQIRFLIRDNIPINFLNWKNLEINDSVTSTSTIPISVVPKREKKMIWDQMKENFTFEGVDEAKMKIGVSRRVQLLFKRTKKEP